MLRLRICMFCNQGSAPGADQGSLDSCVSVRTQEVHMHPAEAEATSVRQRHQLCRRQK